MCVCVFVCRLMWVCVCAQVCVCALVHVHRCISVYMDQCMHAVPVHFLDFLSFFLECSSHHAFFHCIVTIIECSRVCSDRFFHSGALNFFINVLQLMPWVSPHVMYIDWCCVILHIETIYSWSFVCFVYNFTHWDDLFVVVCLFRLLLLLRMTWHCNFL